MATLLVSLGRHSLAIAILLAVLFVLFRAEIASDEMLWDEATYFGAFEKVLADRSPYEVPGYYYFPVFAAAGAALIETAGPDRALVLLRGLNLTALTVLVWASMAVLPVSYGRRLVVAVAIMLLAPGVRLGVVTGNYSFLATALFLLGLLVGFRRPLQTGLLLGASIVVKPLAAAALPALVIHRGSPDPDPRQRILLVGGGAAMAWLLLAGARFWPGFFALGSANLHELYPGTRTASMQRLLYSVGLDLSPTVVAAAVTLLGMAVARLRAWNPTQLMVVAIAASTLATPMLWNHTLLVTLPIQALAARIAWNRVRALDSGRSADPRRRRFRLYEAIAVAVGILAIQLSDGVGAFLPQPSPQLFMALLPVCLAPPLLAAYVVRGLDLSV